MVFLFLGSTENEIQILTDTCTNTRVSNFIAVMSYVIGHKLYLPLQIYP